MFSLIITIISIALVVALAAASVYYGGSAFTSNGVKAQAAALVTQGQQIGGAVTLAINDGAAHATPADLITGNYLTSTPVAAAKSVTAATPWAITGTSATLGNVVQAVCDQANLNSGYAKTAVVADAAAAVAGMTAAYGCQPATTGANVLVYKN